MAVSIPRPEGGVEPAPADVRSYLRMVWRRKWAALVCLLVIPGGVYFLSSRIPKTYESGAELQVRAQSVDTSLFTTDTAAPEQALAATARLVRTTPVARVAAAELGMPSSSAPSLARQIKVTPDPEAGFLTVTAADRDPRRAAAVANAFARALVKIRTDRARSRIGNTISQVERDLASLPSSDVEGRRQLSGQLQRLRALRAAQGDNVVIVESAAVPRVAVSPHPRRNTGLAIVVALLLATGLVLVLDRMDRRVRDPEELEHLAGTPLLGIVPTSAFPRRRSARNVPEAFQTLRTSLTYFNIDRPVETVIVISPLQGDGKTTVATHLARAVAWAGNDVALLDLDLRHPQAHRRLGCEAGDGVASLLVGKKRIDEVLVDVEVDAGRLQLVPAGEPPPNPSELISSQRMRSLLIQLSVRMDLVIIDTPPALEVADAIPLLEQVSGVILVARLGRTSRDAIQRLSAVISAAGGKLLGVVATGAKHGGLYDYGPYGRYGYGYGYVGKRGQTTSNGELEEGPGPNIVHGRGGSWRRPRSQEADEDRHAEPSAREDGLSDRPPLDPREPG